MELYHQTADEKPDHCTPNDKIRGQLIFSSTLSRKIGTPGVAPGEFTNLWGIHYNGSNIFAFDSGRIQVFTETLEYVDSFSYSSWWREFVVSPDYMLLECPGGDWLVCTRGTSPPYTWIESSKLIPVLDMPDLGGENSYVASISPDGNRIAIGYHWLPYIFIYDNKFRHLQTIRFEGEDVRNFEAIGIPGEAPPEVVEPGTFSFIETITFINSRYLVARVHRIDNYIFDLSGEDYELARKIIFRPINDPEERKNVAAKDFLLHRGYLYVASPWEEYVYGYEFDL